MASSPLGSDRGLTRLESALVSALIIVVLAVAAVTLLRALAADTQVTFIAHAQPTPSAEPQSVRVTAAGTVDLPRYAPALDFSAVRSKARYQCADPVHYRLLGGQTVSARKKCVLRSTKAGHP